MEQDNRHLAAAAPESVSEADELTNAVRVLAGKLDLRSLEKMYILQTLETVNGSRRAAVERLGISERTLRNKLQQYRLQALN